MEAFPIAIESQTRSFEFSRNTGAHVNAVCLVRVHGTLVELGSCKARWETTMKLRTLCALPFCAGCFAAPAFSDTASKHCPPPQGELYCTITCNGVKANAHCEGANQGSPVCVCEQKGAQGGRVTIRCKSGTKSDTCGANERPFGNCSGGKIRVGCTNWAR
jgi:hypothetical protein